jgi:hypothetical protein
VQGPLISNIQRGPNPRLTNQVENADDDEGELMTRIAESRCLAREVCRICANAPGTQNFGIFSANSLKHVSRSSSSFVKRQSATALAAGALGFGLGGKIAS